MSAQRIERTQKENPSKIFKFKSPVTERLACGPEKKNLRDLQHTLQIRISSKNLGARTIEICGPTPHINAAVALLERIDREADLLAADKNIQVKSGINKSHWIAIEAKFADLATDAKALVDDDKRLARVAFDAASRAKEEVEASLTPYLRPVLSRQQGNASVKTAKAGGKIINLSPEDFTPRNQTQSIYFTAMNDPETSVIFGAGPAGGGKSYPALRAGFEAYNRGDVEKILLIRPRVVTSKESFGALKGGLGPKVRPYMDGQADNLEQLAGRSIEDLENKGILETSTPDFHRGRTYSHLFVIIDEAQNLSRNEAELLVSRLGEGCKLVFDGDISPRQNDLRGEISGLAHLIATQGNKFSENEDLRSGMAFLRFDAGDSSARHALLPHIHDALDNPSDEYAEILKQASASRRDFALASAIEAAAQYALSTLERAHVLTIHRYAAKAMQRWPELFSDDSPERLHGLKNVSFLHPEGSQNGHAKANGHGKYNGSRLTNG